uniref:Uncharacterized protein n=1 Tax=Lepeophtheirus salmonis TaxID=72036 RepID=A0A0K2UG20_LEPSM
MTDLDKKKAINKKTRLCHSKLLLNDLTHNGNRVISSVMKRSSLWILLLTNKIIDIKPSINPVKAGSQKRNPFPNLLDRLIAD